MAKYFDLLNSANVTIFKQNGKILRSAKFRQCHNVGTLIQCDAFVDVADQETGECETSITNSWLGPQPRPPNRDKRQFSRTYLHPRPLFVFGLKCKTHLARPRFLLFIEKYFLQYVTIIMLIKHKINIYNLGLSFISVGRPRRGPWPGVCFAHFTFPHLWV